MICEDLEHRTGGISNGGRRVSDLQYADDTTSIASDEEEMVELINPVNIASKKQFLINASKTKVIVVDQTKCVPVSTDLSEYKKVDAFGYLSCIIEADGGSSAKIHH